MKKVLAHLLLCCFVMVAAKAQKMLYAKPNSNDRTMDDYEIIGNYNGNILVYKRLQDKTIISVYNSYMNEMSRNNLNIDPNKIVKTDFIAYPDFSYMIFQFMTQNLVFCMAAKLGADGKMIGKPVQLDYYEVKQTNGAANVFPYSILCSEDKKRLMVLKANKINDEKYSFKTLLFDENLSLKHNGQAELAIIDSTYFINEFALANDGNLVFLNGAKPSTNGHVPDYFLQEKSAFENYFITDTIKMAGTTVKDVRLNIDNINKQYVLTSFYYDFQTANIEGVFHAAWDRKNNEALATLKIQLSDETKASALGIEKGKPAALTNFYLQNIILKKDGGFLITAEGMHTSTTNSATISTPAAGFANQVGLNLSPILPGNRTTTFQTLVNQNYPLVEPKTVDPQQVVSQMNADNILVLSFSKIGKLEESNVVKKSQFIDQTNGSNISYALVNTGDGLRFLYNSFEKLNARLPTYQTIDANGQLGLPMVFDFDKKIALLPRYAKQTGLRQVIIPCISRTLFSFSKVDF